MIQKLDIPISLEILWAAAIVDSVYTCLKVVWEMYSEDGVTEVDDEKAAGTNQWRSRSSMNLRDIIGG